MRWWRVGWLGLSEQVDWQNNKSPRCMSKVLLAQTKDAVSKLPATGGATLLLESLRFCKQKESNDPVFAGQLDLMADACVNDAFGTCQRARSSVSGAPAICCPRKSVARVVLWLPKSRIWISQVLDPKTRLPPVSVNRWVTCCLLVLLRV